MPNIQLLDPVTVNQIAAGEVIDRPASVIKEAIENSLDAGASQVSIFIEDGGKKTIRITDNGHGISKDDLPLAPLQHATSKIKALSDIYSISSFGFRGEALASMCHAGHLKIASKTADDNAYEITAHNDRITEPVATQHPNGSTIELLDLFASLPVRRQFLKTANTEAGHVYDVVQQFALVFPDIDFVLQHGQKEMLNTTGISDQTALTCSLWGKSIKDQLASVDTRIGEIQFSGIVGAPSLSFANRAKQIVAVNGRLVKSPVLGKAISMAYQDSIVPRRFPLVVLNITLPGDTVDVNIHPQKLDIKFIAPGLLFDAIPKAIRLSLQTRLADMPVPEQQGGQLAQNDLPHYQRPGLLYSDSEPSPSYVPTPQHSTPPQSEPVSITESPLPYAPLDRIDIAPDTRSEERPAAPAPQYFQVLDTYIILKADDGIWLLDQHAVHERILYEQIKVNYESQEDIQGLLLSETITLAPDMMDVFRSCQAHLSNVGITAEEFGPDTVIIRELPASFTNISISSWLVDFLDHMKRFPDLKADLTFDQKDKLQMMACKAAIKAGKRLSEAEVIALLKDLQKCPDNYTCPHGRPLYIKLNQSKLERLFLRS